VEGLREMELRGGIKLGEVMGVINCKEERMRDS
jgi:hypothetical protein